MGRVIPFVACVLVASIANATVLVPAEFREIVAGSQIITFARITNVRTEWADGRRWVDSVVTAEVMTTFKGDPAQEEIIFKVPGGQLGRYRSVVVGAPTFARGDEAVLFLTRDLTRDADGLPQVFGLNQGVFRVRVDSRTGQRMVLPPPIIQSTPSAPEPQPVTRGAIDRKPLAFEAFGARVRDVMASRAPAPRGAR